MLMVIGFFQEPTGNVGVHEKGKHLGGTMSRQGAIG